MTESIRRLCVLLAVSAAALLLFCGSTLPAQTYEGRILGTVTDSSGASVAGAKIQITNAGTAISRNLQSNEAGDFVAPNLEPGLYSVTVEAPGFKKVQRTGIRLEVGKDARIDIALAPGAVEQTVQVTEDVPLVETTNDTLGGSFENKAINDLPLNGRDYQNLVTLRPGVQRGPGGGFLSISSNGNRPEDNNFIFDGADNNDPYYGVQMINTEGVQGTPGSILPIDAIQEFNTVENPPADYGWKPGAIINLGIKSGTNDLHGTGYYFGRNNALDARNFFNPGIDPNTGNPSPQKAVRQHQFGGSLGGPIIKNKTFIFGAYEGVRAFVANSDVIPTPATGTLGGDPANSIPDALRDLMAHSASGGPATFTCAGVPVNTTALNPLSANLIGCGAFTGNGAYPGLLPLNNSQSTNISTGFPNQNRGDNFVIKADHHFNEHHMIAARYFFGDSLQTEQDIPVRQPEWRSQSKIRVQVFGANYNWIVSPSFVNEIKFGYNRFYQTILTLDNNKDPLATYGINSGTSAPNLGMPTIIIGGFGQSTAPTLGGNKGWPLETIPDQTYVFSDNMSYTHGRHSFRFGTESRRGATDNLRNREGKGLATFSGGANFFFPLIPGSNPPTTTSTPLEDFLSGNPSSGQIFVGNSERNVSMVSFGVFFQDDWRVTPHLTVNAGLRWDISSAIREKNNLLGNFDPVKGLEQVGLNIGSPYNVDYKNFGPRLGIAWDPRGNAKTVIRAGGAIIYEIPHFAAFIGQNGVNNGTTTGLNVIPTGTFGSAIPGGSIVGASPSVSPNWNTGSFSVFPQTAICVSNAPCDILGVRRDLRTPYAMSWNLNIQQALTNSLSLQVGYVGNRGVQLYSVRDINQLDPTSAAEVACGHCEANAHRPFAAQFPFLRYINFLENNYTSTYHGLQVSATQRAWHGFSYVLGYTWSHSIDDASLNRAPQPQNSFNSAAERGNSDLDVRNRFTFSTTYDIPGRKGYAQLLEGWQLNSIVVLQGGLPWTAFDFNDDVSKTGEFSDRWDLKPGVSQGSIPGFVVNKPYPISQFFQPPTCPPCFGNMGRNIFRGPHYRNWDFSVSKAFRVTERFSAQLRGEFFNILNHTNFGIPGSLLVNAFNNDFSSPGSFGQVPGTPDVVAANPVIGSGGPRNIQLGLKLRF